MRRRALDPQSIEPHLDRLARVARALTGVQETADDLVQATCLRVLGESGRFRGDELTHLLATMHGLFTDERRGRRRLVTRSGPPAPRDVFAIVAELPAEQRDAVATVDVGGLDHAAAAELLGIRGQELGMRLYRGRDRVARELAS